MSETGAAYGISAHKGAWLCLLALLCPPISVVSIEGCNSKVLLNVFLTLFGWLPGMWHAYYIVGKHAALRNATLNGAGNIHIVQKLERLELGLGAGAEYEYVIDYAGHRYRRDPVNLNVGYARRVPLAAHMQGESSTRAPARQNSLPPFSPVSASGSGSRSSSGQYATPNSGYGSYAGVALAGVSHDYAPAPAYDHAKTKSGEETGKKSG